MGLFCSMWFGVFNWSQPCHDGRNEQREQNGARAAAPLTDHGGNSTESAQHEAGDEGIEHIGSTTGRRHDDGQEHAIESHAEG